MAAAARPPETAKGTGAGGASRCGAASAASARSAWRALRRAIVSDTAAINHGPAAVRVCTFWVAIFALNALLLVIRNADVWSFLLGVLSANVFAYTLVVCGPPWAPDWGHRPQPSPPPPSTPKTPPETETETATETGTDPGCTAPRQECLSLSAGPLDLANPYRRRDVALKLPHTWSPALPSSFMLRQGPNYAQLRRKGPARDSLYDALGCHAFRTERKLEHLARFAKIPEGASWKDGIPDFLIVSLLVPGYPASWRNCPWDGPGCIIAICLKLKEGVRERRQQPGCPPGVTLLHSFCRDYKAGAHRRLKCVPSIANLEALALPRLVARLFNQYNGRPFLTGPNCHRFWRGAGYLEVSVDFHRFCFPVRKLLSEYISAGKQMIVDIGFCIQGETDEELPEALLGGVRLCFADVDKATVLRLDKDISVPPQPQHPG